jgi:hypothetical protein
LKNLQFGIDILYICRSAVWLSHTFSRLPGVTNPAENRNRYKVVLESVAREINILTEKEKNY